MNDLLNEEEFLPKEYNPKKWFIGFYIICIVTTSFVFYIETIFNIEGTDSSATIISITEILTPLILSIIMIFGRSNNTLKLSKKRTIHSVGLLTFFGCIALTIHAIIDGMVNKYVVGIEVIALVILILILYTVIYGIALVIILPILKRAQKINHLPQ
ncbi:hypothetical protein ACLI09_08485 [Flavobacterium sp. RHBU_24]|uniref:hypothetical protein n=1 Tax=Flavobacterium sp. RHBU_24 TaxID=3391185 RepID=UPI003985465A